MFGYLSGKMFDWISGFGGKNKLSPAEIEKALFTVQEILIGADVPFKLVKEISEALRENLSVVDKSSNIKLQDRVQATLYKKLLEILGSSSSEEKETKFEIKKKSIILMAGLQGAGKTTTIAKLANFAKKELGFKKILATSLDFVRPAAIEQLKILAEKNNFDFQDPIAGDISTTINNAKQKFITDHYDCLFVDTPGRLHVNSALMHELQEIYNTTLPNYTFLVIDSMTGQESLNVAKAFDDIVPLTGGILSKADSDSKGGVALSFFSSLKKPILFLGNGEKVDDLENFVPKRIVSRMLGEGDILSLVENVEKRINEEDKNKFNAAGERFFSGKHTLQDFLEQMEIINSMGSLQKIMSYLPGVGKVSEQQISQAEKEIKKLKAMILSLTPKERNNPEILNRSRRLRVAAGSGLLERDISDLLNKFEESRRYAKLIGGGNWKSKF